MDIINPEKLPRPLNIYMHIRVDDYKVSPIVNPKNVPQPLYIFMHITVDGYEVSLCVPHHFFICKLHISIFFH